jgi:hypothetical protein
MANALPDGWEQAIAEPIAKRFGHTVRLAESVEIGPGGEHLLDVFVDGELSGDLLVYWDETWPRGQVLTDLREQIEELCAQELGSGI